MSYHLEGKDLVIDGFGNGVSDSPYNGAADMRGMNIVSVPGEAAVSFAQVNKALAALVCTITSVDTGTDVITVSVSSGSVQNFQAVTFTTTGSLPSPLVADTTYWVNFQGSNTFKLFSNCYLNGSAINLTTSGSGTNTATSINLWDASGLTAGTGGIRYFERNYGFALDYKGRCWSITSSGVYTYMGNLTTNAHGNGLVVYKGTGSQLYLFVFRDGRIDYTPISNVLQNSYASPNWVSSWDPATGTTGGSDTLNTASGTDNPHEALVGQDNVIYYTDSSYLGSLRERAGATFDPTSTATYTFNQKALSIPKIDIAQCLEELGTNLLVGGLYNYVYPWNRLAPNFNYPIFIAEKGTTRLLTVNTNCYIFAGQRGRIFVTNGSQTQLFKKMPDHILGIDPTFTFYGVAYNKNQIYFGVSARTNAGTVSSSYSGLWAIDLDTEALRAPTLQSTTTATVTAMFSPPYIAVGGSPYSNTGFGGLQVAWKTVDSNNVITGGGIDSSTDAPYTDYTPYIDTEIIPVGQFLSKQTFNNLEFKLSAPLVSGEGIKISYRSNITSSYTLIDETTAAGSISDVYTPNFQNVEWVQLRINTKSTASSPSYTRLTEIRLRANTTT